MFQRKHDLKRHMVSHSPDELKKWGYSVDYLRYEVAKGSEFKQRLEVPPERCGEASRREILKGLGPRHKQHDPRVKEKQQIELERMNQKI